MKRTSLFAAALIAASCGGVDPQIDAAGAQCLRSSTAGAEFSLRAASESEVRSAVVAALRKAFADCGAAAVAQGSLRYTWEVGANELRVTWSFEEGLRSTGDEGDWRTIEIGAAEI